MCGMMNRYVQAPYLSPGFSDFGDGQSACVGGRDGCVDGVFFWF